jgi:hypothetical protein
MSVMQRVGVEVAESTEDKGRNTSIPQGKSCLETKGERKGG